MRACGDCQTCCTVAEIHGDGWIKPAWSPCQYQCATGCSVHAQPAMPRMCADFGCAWYHGVGDQDYRPDLIGLMFLVKRTERGRIGLGVEIREGALRSTGGSAAICQFVRATGLPLIITAHDRRPPHDVGDWIAVKREHVLISFSMRGPHVADLANDVLLYEYAHRRAA